jgi:hypothetical protein
MANKFMIGLAFAMLCGCSTPKIADPRFELPAAPSELTAPDPQLKTIVATPVTPNK